MRSFAADRDILLIEGTGHAGVGAVIDLSNADVASMLGAPAVIVSEGGVGRPIDEIVLNKSLFERSGVTVAGAIVNKVDLLAKPDLARTLERGLARHGIRLLGVLPYRPILSNPTLAMVLEGVKGETIHPGPDLDQVIGGVSIGAMEPQHMLQRIGPRALVIVPGDREDVIGAIVHARRVDGPAGGDAIGLVLTGGYRPRSTVLDAIRYVGPLRDARATPTRTRSRPRSTTCSSRPTPPTRARSRRSRRSSGNTSSSTGSSRSRPRPASTEPADGASQGRGPRHPPSGPRGRQDREAVTVRWRRRRSHHAAAIATAAISARAAPAPAATARQDPWSPRASVSRLVASPGAAATARDLDVRRCRDRRGRGQDPEHGSRRAGGGEDLAGDLEHHVRCRAHAGDALLAVQPDLDEADAAGRDDDVGDVVAGAAWAFRAEGGHGVAASARQQPDEHRHAIHRASRRRRPS